MNHARRQAGRLVGREGRRGVSSASNRPTMDAAEIFQREATASCMSLVSGLFPRRCFFFVHGPLPRGSWVMGSLAATYFSRSSTCASVGLRNTTVASKVRNSVGKDAT
ncbi:hypothetical protein JDV02_007603 [Purpureocillium takamizusanense]|uniref:Uncharacterized protein n=1 Tax=Purpureocillium takamizusanense TaxID=2060973 RepID=A0A9Q8QLX1_9HYPO|nr:uncharacterized protein JDV02_007603 [Purpureocillium takamizusanense]UNI21627.1 hypothetical protein JDV02_007603 [Purpureocillium takamizusanense]